MKGSFKRPRITFIAIVALLIVLLFGFCKQETKHKVEENENNGALTIPGYDLKHPFQSWKLPEQLKEISGIVKLGGDSLLAIEDLHASLYFLKLQNPNSLPFSETSIIPITKNAEISC